MYLLLRTPTRLYFLLTVLSAEPASSGWMARFVRLEGYEKVAEGF